MHSDSSSIGPLEAGSLGLGPSLADPIINNVSRLPASKDRQKLLQGRGSEGRTKTSFSSFEGIHCQLKERVQEVGIRLDGR